LTTAYLLCKTQ